jgi:4-methyl-5(b-hydroxyethyl)-thiazole monophosphate biosynthesis
MLLCTYSSAGEGSHENGTASNPTRTVLVPLADTFEDTEAIPIISILRRAGADVTVASLDEIVVTSARNLKVIADKKLSECKNDKYDLIVLHGGMPAAEYLRDSETLKQMLIEQNQQRRLYAAICASPAVVFNAHGLLKGKQATCYPSMEKYLPDNSTSEKRVVVDQHCITSQGPGTAMEFAITLVESLYGNELAEKLKKGYLIK